MSIVLRVASIVISLLISWLLFTWMIARLPRESISFRSAARAGLMVAVAFEIFKQVASIYLESVVTGPAGATFGPVLGLMVFAYITARMILFATAWAATSKENLEAAPVDPPVAAQITPRVQVREGLGTGWRAHRGGRGSPWCTGLFAFRPAPLSPARLEYHAATVGRRFQLGDRTMWSERIGETTDQGVVHLADELRLRLCQRVKRTVGHDDPAVVGAGFVAVLGERFDSQGQRRPGGARRLVADRHVAEVSSVRVRQAVQRFDDRGSGFG